MSETDLGAGRDGQGDQPAAAGTTNVAETPARIGPSDGDAVPAYSRPADQVVVALDSDATTGLSPAEAASRLTQYGPNQITSQKPPSIWEVALGQLRDPMNIMLVGVTVVSLVIDQVPTGIVVALLVLLNVLLGTRQELQAQASVDALSKMQVPQARVMRAGQVVLIPAVDIVPGDIVQVEAADIVPA